MGFTFKKQPKETGLASRMNPYTETDIKLGGKVVGYIVPPSRIRGTDKWVVRLAVATPNVALGSSHANSPGFSWEELRMEFDTEPEARVYIKANAKKLEGYGLWPLNR